MPHVYITGDKHGSYKDVEQFCLRWNTSRDDLLIVLGDNGVNYWGADDRRDRKLKAYLSSLPISFYMIKGNHDQRPSSQKYHIGGENLHPLFRGSCLVENSYPSLLFAPMYGACHLLTNGKNWKKATEYKPDGKKEHFEKDYRSFALATNLLSSWAARTARTSGIGCGCKRRAIPAGAGSRTSR